MTEAPNEPVLRKPIGGCVCCVDCGTDTGTGPDGWLTASVGLVELAPVEAPLADDPVVAPAPAGPDGDGDPAG